MRYFFQNWHEPILFKCIRCPDLNYILTHVEIVMVIHLVMVFFLFIEILIDKKSLKIQKGQSESVYVVFYIPNDDKLYSP